MRRKSSTSGSPVAFEPLEARLLLSAELWAKLPPPLAAMPQQNRSDLAEADPGGSPASADEASVKTHIPEDRPAPESKTPGDQWTFMVYIAADNNLEGAAIDDFLEMASVGSDDSINIVVLMDRIPGYDSSYDNWTDTRRGIIMLGDVPDTGWGQSIGEANTGDPATVIDFVNWAVGGYPAANYALVLWNHGGGWRSEGAAGVPLRDSCMDDTDNDYLANREVGGALEAIPENMDLFGYDCCLMGMIECGHEIMNEASIFVASEQTEPLDGWAYDTALADLAGNPTMTAAELGTAIAIRYGESYGGQETLSVVDLAVMADAYPQGLSATVSELASVIMDDATSGDYQRLQGHRNSSAYFTETEHRDLGTFLANVAGDSLLTPSIRAAAQTALNAYDNAVIYNHSGPGEDGTGMAIYFQSAGSQPSASYSSSVIDFAADTQWDEFLQWWAQGPPPNAISGSKWYDVDQDGLWDAGEPPLPDWTIYLDLNENGAFDDSTFTVHSTDVPQGIYDYTTTTSTLQVGAVGGNVIDVNVTLDITHTWDADLDVYLISPSGTAVELFTDVGSSKNNFTNTTLDDEAGTAITSGSAPFTGSYRPEGLLADFDGENPNGTWTLEVYDDARRNEGTLNSWSVAIAVAEPSTQTGANGGYSFSDVAPGSYTVREVNQGGWTQTFPAGGHTVSIGPGEVVEDVNFGNYAPPSWIEGTKWHDLDGDGEWDAGEPGMQGWTIYADLNANGRWDDHEPFDVTDPGGDYSIPVMPGTYVVAEQAQVGWEQTFPIGGAGGLFYAWDAWGEALFTVSANGSITDLAPPGGGAYVTGLAYDTAQGILYGSYDALMWTFDLGTGAATPIGALPVTISSDLTYNPLDDLLYSVTDTGALVRINPDTLSATVVSGPGPGIGASGVAFSPLDGRIYAHSNGSPRVWSYDAVTFAGPATHTDPDTSPHYGMTFDGAYLVLADGVSVDNGTFYTYDPDSGTTTPLFPVGLLGARGIDAVEYVPGSGAGTHTVEVGPGQTVGDVDFRNALIGPDEPDLMPESDSGQSDNDDLTNLDNSSAPKALQFRVTGTAAGATVIVYAGGTEIGREAASGPITIVTTNGSYDLHDGEHSITARHSASGVETQDSDALTVTIDTQAPRVGAFGLSSTSAMWTLGTVDSSEWTKPARTQRTAPWSNVNLFVFDFTEAVVGVAGGMTLEGSQTGPVGLTGPSGSASARLTWGSAAYLDSDRYEIVLISGVSGVEDLAGNALDGEGPMDVFPSGDGLDGGDWSFDLNVLRGDATGDGVVGVVDLGRVATYYDKGPVTFAQGDFNADQWVDSQDLGILATYYDHELPPPQIETYTTAEGAPDVAGGGSRDSLVSRWGPGHNGGPAANGRAWLPGVAGPADRYGYDRLALSPSAAVDVPARADEHAAEPANTGSLPPSARMVAGGPDADPPSADDYPDLLAGPELNVLLTVL